MLLVQNKAVGGFGEFEFVAQNRTNNTPYNSIILVK